METGYFVFNLFNYIYIFVLKDNCAVGWVRDAKKVVGSLPHQSCLCTPLAQSKHKQYKHIMC